MGVTPSHATLVHDLSTANNLAAVFSISAVQTPLPLLTFDLAPAGIFSCSGTFVLLTERLNGIPQRHCIIAPSDFYALLLQLESSAPRASSLQRKRSRLLAATAAAITECCICQDAECDVTLPCAHAFCRTCITAWS